MSKHHYPSTYVGDEAADILGEVIENEEQQKLADILCRLSVSSVIELLAWGLASFIAEDEFVLIVFGVLYKEWWNKNREKEARLEVLLAERAAKEAADQGR